jgi:hypothetical protein
MPLDPSMIEAIAPVGVSLVFMGTIGWVVTTWLRVKNGYPLESSWGKPLFPQLSNEAMERVKLMAQENAQLRAELGSVKDRLQVLERIAVDRGTRLAEEIDSLAAPKALN